MRKLAPFWAAMILLLAGVTLGQRIVTAGRVRRRMDSRQGALTALQLLLASVVLQLPGATAASCEAGTYSSAPVLSADECTVALPGTFATAGSTQPTPCAIRGRFRAERVHALHWRHVPGRGSHDGMQVVRAGQLLR